MHIQICYSKMFETCKYLRTKRMGRNTRYVYLKWNLESKVSLKGRKVEVSAKKGLELKTGEIGNADDESKPWRKNVQEAKM